MGWNRKSVPRDHRLSSLGNPRDAKRWSSLPIFYVFMCLSCLIMRLIYHSRFIPESYRWLVARGRFGEAEVVIKQMAHRNGRPVPDLNKVRQRMKEDLDFIKHEKSLRIYTIIDLFRTWKLFKITTFFAFIWWAFLFLNINDIAKNIIIQSMLQLWMS